jgi:hypothetical protein
MPNFTEHKFAVRALQKRRIFYQAVFMAMKILADEKPLVYEVESDRRLEDLDYVCHQNE